MARYNPMSYHNGSVWPHDTALCAAGLMRYGCVDEAQRLALALLDAAEHFDWRLPELFSGFDRRDLPTPVRYPAACSPQAWAAAAPVLLLRTLLRLDPDLPYSVRCSPRMPSRLLPFRISHLRLGPSIVSVEVDAAGSRITGLPDDLQSDLLR